MWKVGDCVLAEGMQVYTATQQWVQHALVEVFKKKWSEPLSSVRGRYREGEEVDNIFDSCEEGENSEDVEEFDDDDDSEEDEE